MIERPDRLVSSSRAPSAQTARLERFQAKWMPVRVKKTRQNKKIELRSDSIGTEKALVRCELAKQFTHPVDHDPRRGIALEMVLDKEPHVTALREERRAQVSIGQQVAAHMFRQYADRRM